MLPYVFVSTALLLTILGQVAMRWRAGTHAPNAAGDKLSYMVSMYTDPVILLALFFGLAASASYALALEKLPISVAYPFMAMSFVLVPLLSRGIFGDSLSMAQLAGMALIVAGVFLTSQV